MICACFKCGFLPERGLHGMLVLIFSTREALKEAKERQRELELEIKEVILTGFQQKEEEIKRVREWLKEQQAIQLAGVKASEQILRYP